MTFLVLLGAPGAGKGTQAAILAERLAIPHVATGDLFRSAVRVGSAIGLEARRFMERGQLVPDDITVRMLLDRLAEPDAAGGRHPRRLPAHEGPGRGARRALAEHGGRVDHASRSRSRPTSWSAGCPVAGSAPRTATSTTRPATRRACPVAATSTARRSSSARTTGPRRSGPASRSSSRRSARSPATTASGASCEAVDGRHPVEAVADAILAIVRPTVGSETTPRGDG